MASFQGAVYQIMQLQKLVNMFGGDLTRRYGQKVHKLTLHGGFSCPNRDGTIGRGGCTFCNVASFADEAQQHRSIAEQLAHQANLVNRAKRYLAYFQAYTSTFAEVQVLRSMYQQAVSQANIVGLCVGTRPDCVPDAVLDLLCEYKDQGYEVWLELGLQTAHDKTLHRINRGHDFACYQRTTQLARQRGLKVCSHLIVGLPGEGQAECLQTLERVVETGVDGIKLHPLHIVKGSIMAKAWEAGRLNGIRTGGLHAHCRRNDSPYATGSDLPPHFRQRPSPDAACSAVVRKSMDGNGRAGSLSE
ncbi:TIGR01212 family radical SAM protein [Escherichia coli]|nr:TIGR01212 family radical SAM protein [Escherichia coli]